MGLETATGQLRKNAFYIRFYKLSVQMQWFISRMCAPLTSPLAHEPVVRPQALLVARSLARELVRGLDREMLRGLRNVNLPVW